jgi:hypothetical protein
MEFDWIKHVFENVYLQDSNLSMYPKLTPYVHIVIKHFNSDDKVIEFCKSKDISLFQNTKVKTPEIFFKSKFSHYKSMSDKLPNIPLEGDQKFEQVKT